MSKLFSEGIIVTNGRAMEKLATTDHVVFDKTGTLTEGRMVVKTCRVLSSAHDETFAFEIAASLEILSDHPIAQAFRPTQAHTLMETSNVVHKTGLGICGKVNGVQYYLGSNKLIESVLVQPIDDTGISNTHIYLADENALIAIFEIDDTIRAGVKSTLSWLTKHGKKVSLLSGDQKTAVRWFAKKVGIRDYSAEVSPTEKLLFIEQLQHQCRAVAMVGDGINDAPVLAKADVSIAVSTASQLARASSDILLLRHDMNSLKHVFILSKKTKQIILQNMSWALIYNLGALPLALLGHIQPWQAALGMSISSLIVVLNSFRIRFQSQSTT
jgi:Cu2+-exporting ATPase